MDMGSFPGPVLRADKVKKVFRANGKEIEALRETSLEVGRGECLLVRGASGCGKTTLLNAVGCLVRPTAGAVWVMDREVSRLPEHMLVEVRRKWIGFVFQQFHLLAKMDAVANVCVPLVPAGLSEGERRVRAIELLEGLGLSHCLGVAVNELSGGEQQRVAIARALVNGAQILLADEPTSNLDDESSAEAIEILRKLKHEGRTIVLSSHDPQVVAAGIHDRELTMGKERS